MTYLSLWDAMRATQGRQPIRGFNAYIKQSELSQTNNLITHLKHLRKRTTGQIPNQ